MTIHSNPLDAKIAARNAVHAAALEYWPKLRVALCPFVGKKITTVSGRLTAKVLAALPESGAGRAQPTPVHLWYQASSYTLRVTFEVCECSAGRHDCSIAQYAETCIPLGDIKDGVLTDLIAPYDLRTDYNADNIRELREQVQTVRNELQTLENCLVHFGEHDNG